MYAVIRDGGRQFTVREGDRILVDRKNVQENAEIRFDEVLLVGDANGAKVGTPTVAGAAVLGTVLCERKGEKLIVFKYRRRKDSKVKKCHRQKYTVVRVQKIQG